MKTCSACGATIARTDCHRNRYGEYICHACQARGVRFTWRRRLQTRWRQFRKSGGRQVAWVVIVLGSASAGLVWLVWLLD